MEEIPLGKKKENGGLKLDYKKTILTGFGFLATSIAWAIYDPYITKILNNLLSNSSTVTAWSNWLVEKLPILTKFAEAQGENVALVGGGFTLVPLFIGIIMTFDNIFGVIFQPTFGKLSDNCHSKLGKRRPFIVIGAPISAVLFFLIPIVFLNTHSLPLTMVFIILFVFVMSLWRAPIVALMPDLTPPALRSEGNAVINLMGAFGGLYTLIMMKVAVTTDAAGNANYTALFASVAGLMVTAIAILVLTIREKKLVAEMKAINYGVNEDEDQGKTETVNGKEKLPKPVLKSLLLILTTIGLWFLGYNAVTTFFTSYATATWSGGLSHASTCLMVATVAAVASYIPIGMISAKIGRRNMIRIGLLTAAAGFAVATFCAREFSFYLYIVFAVVGFAQASVTVNTFPMVWEISRSGNVGKYTGFDYTVSMTAQTVTPFLVGIFLDKLGNDALFPYGLVFVLLALIPISLAKHGDNRPEAPKSKLEAFDVDD